MNEQDLIKYFESYLSSDNKVDNIVKDTMEYLFVLESPHTQELKNKYPLAGYSGKKIAKFFGDNKNSFGKIVKENSKCNIGIMNVCQCPLQNINPPQEDNSEKDIYEEMMNVLEFIRKNYKSIFKHRQNLSIANEIEKKIFNNFKESLMEIIIKYKDIKYIIVCGEFAKAYINQIKIDDNIKVIYTTHPSFIRKDWEIDDEGIINDIKDKLNL